MSKSKPLPPPPAHAVTLRAILEKRDISQADFAKAAGLHRADITNILQGVRVPGSIVFAKIVSALGESDGARFAEVYFADLLPDNFTGKVHIAKGGAKTKSADIPEDAGWALRTLEQAMKSNEHLQKVVLNLARCHQ
ncbi:HTH_XRE domain containing protein [uncultured Caudovirales phage]|uniref:HTH_XRE domain containing protein n=1 Tax=uncultured Caudovirales phage TaxID=2100421 RepID=A0A6J5NUK2_9CAUD|nr:HTH_XRE domain containing protein [uncultured Caudovirales phage]CAB5224282.1 HTH_XRE domain containing protein [uncultured Caudovirales phage]